jgi:hypothetical protein
MARPDEQVVEHLELDGLASATTTRAASIRPSPILAVVVRVTNSSTPIVVGVEHLLHKGEDAAREGLGLGPGKVAERPPLR